MAGLDVVDPVSNAIDRAQSYLPPGQGQAAPPAAPPSAQDRLVNDFMESQKRQDATFAASEREKEPLRQQAEGMLRQPGPTPPHLQRETEPPKANTQQMMQEWLMPLVALSAITGAFSRGHATTALNAFSAGIQGLRQGDKELYQQKLTEWEAANKKLIANNKASMDEYNAIWNNKKLNLDQKMNELAIVASKYQDKLAYEAAAQKNVTLLAQLLQKQENLAEKLELSYYKMDEKRKEGEEKRKQNDLKQAAIKKFLEEHPDASATEIQQFNSQSRPPRSAPAMALAKYLQENPEANSEDITKFAANYAGEAAGARTAGTREEGLKIILRATNAAIPAALEASDKVSRTGFVPLNRIIQKGQIATSDPDLRSFGMANLQLAEHWAKAMNPTGVMRVDDRQLALDFLSTADSKETYKRLVMQLKTQIERELAAVQAGRGRAGGAAAQPGGPAPSEGGTAAPAAAGGGMSDDELKKKLGL